MNKKKIIIGAIVLFVLLVGIAVTMNLLGLFQSGVNERARKDVEDILEKNDYLEATQEEYKNRSHPIAYPFRGKKMYLYKYEYKEKNKKPGVDYMMCFEDSDGLRLSWSFLKGEYIDFSSGKRASEYYNKEYEHYKDYKEKGVVESEGENFIFFHKYSDNYTGAVFLVRRDDIVLKIYTETNLDMEYLSEDDKLYVLEKPDEWDELIEQFMTKFTTH